MWEFNFSDIYVANEVFFKNELIELDQNGK